MNSKKAKALRKAVTTFCRIQGEKKGMPGLTWRDHSYVPVEHTARSVRLPKGGIIQTVTMTLARACPKWQYRQLKRSTNGTLQL